MLTLLLFRDPAAALSEVFNYFTDLAKEPNYSDVVAAITANPTASAVLASINEAVAAGSTIDTAVLSGLPPQVTSFYGSVANEVNSILEKNNISVDDLDSAVDSLTEGGVLPNATATTSGSSSTRGPSSNAASSTSDSANAQQTDTSAASSLKMAGFSAALIAGAFGLVLAL